MHHKMVDFIDCALTKHISFSLSFPLFLSAALLLLFFSDTTHHHLLSLSPSISISLWFPLSHVVL